MGNIAREVYKTRITGLQLSSTPLMNGCYNDDVIQLGPLRSQSLFQFVQISDACFVHVLLQYSHTLYSTGFKSGEFGGYRSDEINSGVSFSDKAVVAPA